MPRKLDLLFSYNVIMLESDITISLRYAVAEVHRVTAEVHPAGDDRLHSELVWCIRYTESDLSFPEIVVNRNMRFPIPYSPSWFGAALMREHFGRFRFIEDSFWPDALFKYYAEAMIARHTPKLPLHHFDFSKAEWKITSKVSS